MNWLVCIGNTALRLYAVVCYSMVVGSVLHSLSPNSDLPFTLRGQCFSFPRSDRKYRKWRTIWCSTRKLGTGCLCHSSQNSVPLDTMVQGNGPKRIDLSSVDVSYVNSPSWYFLNLVGLRSLFSLILSEQNATDDTQKLMQTQMAMQMGGIGADPAKALGSEKDGLELVLPRVEQRAEGVLKQLLESPDF